MKELPAHQRDDRDDARRQRRVSVPERPRELVARRATSNPRKATGLTSAVDTETSTAITANA
ncbi:MAG: hypothetical protein J4G13_02585 [Dehalococcoidia bacterium]|nr:hypothetical protein [Dehalococcoidia bacterium]